MPARLQISGNCSQFPLLTANYMVQVITAAKTTLLRLDQDLFKRSHSTPIYCFYIVDYSEIAQCYLRAPLMLCWTLYMFGRREKQGVPRGRKQHLAGGANVYSGEISFRCLFHFPVRDHDKQVWRTLVALRTAWVRLRCTQAGHSVAVRNVAQQTSDGLRPLFLCFLFSGSLCSI